jgi:hypothetical protein
MKPTRYLLQKFPSALRFSPPWIVRKLFETIAEF